MYYFTEKDIEFLDKCPNCTSQKMSVVYKNVKDFVSRNFQNRWQYNKCLYCGCLVLNPRPKPFVIERAYEDYHTHKIQPVKSRERSEKLLENIKKRLKNGYRNHKFGNYFYPASKIGILYGLFPFKRRAVLGPIGDIPNINYSGRLLDVGSGSGKVLKLAETLGLEAYGVDFDKVVVDDAKKENNKVSLGGIEVWKGYEGFFDTIIMSHVFEHLYDHDECLRIAYHILKPGGYIWLETPNIDSFGRNKFKGYWRGLEPPRHLVLFNWDQIENKLKETGFQVYKRLRKPFCYYPIGLSSAYFFLEGEGRRSSRFLVKTREKGNGILSEIISTKDFTKSEYVTVLAKKVDSVYEGNPPEK